MPDTDVKNFDALNRIRRRDAPVVDYERGTKSPTFAVVEHIVTSSGYDLDLSPRGHLHRPCRRSRRADRRARSAVASQPRRCPSHRRHPQRLHWSGSSRPFPLRDRGDRARVYEIVLREGESADLLTYLDGALLIDLWHELVLPAAIRRGWEPILSSYGETA